MSNGSVEMATIFLARLKRLESIEAAMKEKYRYFYLQNEMYIEMTEAVLIDQINKLVEENRALRNKVWNFESKELAKR